ncbi:MAG: MFS transporter [Actinomycetes bacterium]
MTGRSSGPRPSRRAYAVWSVGVLAFSLTAMHRTTLGVAGIEASERLDVGPPALSAVLLAQVVVFLFLQIPSGRLVDRWGSRACLVLGSLLVAAGQLVVALTLDLGLLLMGRVLVGAADSLVLVAALALVPRWFPAGRVPVMTQLTALSGQVGQVLSAVPFLALLGLGGWTAAFSAAAATGAFCAVLAVAVVRSRPGARGDHDRGPTAPESFGSQLRAVWGRAGTRLGFFTHLATQFPMMAFALMWGVPYLTAGQGLSPGRAGALVAVLAGATFAIAPVMGWVQQRHPLRRSRLALGVVGVTATTWTAVLLVPPPAPYWLLAVLAVVLALGGPGSVVGFDLARSFNPPRHLGLAQAVVNTGGFAASLLVVLAMGVVLELAGGYSEDGFRLAWLALYPFWLLGTVGVVLTRRRVRAELAREAAGGVRPGCGGSSGETGTASGRAGPGSASRTSPSRTGAPRGS